jgi:hypothetical protein
MFKTMFTRTSLITACGALLGLALVATTLSVVPNASTLNRLEYLTFSGPVALPGVALGAGTYAFEVANPEASADVIRVRSRATKQVIFLGFTMGVERPAGTGRDRSVLLGEAAAGVAVPIVVWYPNGEAMGHKFIYRTR